MSRAIKDQSDHTADPALMSFQFISAITLDRSLLGLARSLYWKIVELLHSACLRALVRRKESFESDVRAEIRGFNCSDGAASRDATVSPRLRAGTCLLHQSRGQSNLVVFINNHSQIDANLARLLGRESRFRISRAACVAPIGALETWKSRAKMIYFLAGALCIICTY
jgi:hypothetical protein